jgi:uncharacterized YigZ family protein
VETIGDNYRTVRGYGEDQFEISKSRFITYVHRVETEAAAMAFIEGIKRKHSDANHNCWAYSVGDNGQCQRADDDGEPQGTAGRPILEVIKKSVLSDTVIVVTRYFGGIKLGAGGLIRAYGKGASVGLKAAGIVERVLYTRIAIKIDYTFQGMVENNLRSLACRIESKQFSEFVTIVVLAEKGKEAVLQEKVKEWTAGTAIFYILDEVYADTEEK